MKQFFLFLLIAMGLTSHAPLPLPAPLPVSVYFDEDFQEGYGSIPSWFPENEIVKATPNTVHGIENNGEPQALSLSTYAGRRGARFRLSKDEPLYQGDQYRTEVTIVKEEEDSRVTEEGWYAEWICFPSDGAASDSRKTSINQWFEDGSDELTLRTMYARCFMELQVGADEYRWDMFSSATTLNDNSVATFAVHPLDEWHQFVFHINHKLDSTGFIYVYRDGVLLHSYTGPTIHLKIPKWKIGIYSSFTSSIVDYKIVHYDNVRVGNNAATLADMMYINEGPTADVIRFKRKLKIVN